MGAGNWMIPPSSPCWLARLCFFTTLSPSITTLPFRGRTRSTLPSLPLNSPLITRTMSPLVTWRICWGALNGVGSLRRFLNTRGFMSDHLGRQRHDLHELLVSQLAAHRPEDAGGAGLALIGDQHRRVLVEADVAAVLAPGLLGRAPDHRLGHFPLLDLSGGKGVLDRHHDHVPQPGVAPAAAAQHPDHQRLPGARVVGDLEYRFLLYHGPTSPIWRARAPTPPATAWCGTGAAFPRCGPCPPGGRPARRAWTRAWSA